MTVKNYQRLPTCRDCENMQTGMMGIQFLCAAPLPKWVELQGQSEVIGQDDDATNCECFKYKDHP